MVMRLNGFSNTGIDIDDTVKKLMAAARMPQDKLKQQKQTLEWQRDDYRSMNSKIMEFRNLAFNMKLKSNYSATKATSTDDTIISATSSPSAGEGIYSLKVNKLAKSASVTSGDVEIAGVKATKGATLEQLGLTASTTLTIGGEKGTSTIVLNKTDTIEGLVAAVNGKSSSTGVTMNYDENIGKIFFVSSSTGTKSNFTLQMRSTADVTGAGTPQNLLSDVLRISGATANMDQGKTITGTRNFASGVGTAIDDTLTGTQKLRIKVGADEVDFDITKTTTISKLVDSINSSAIGKAGFSAYVDGNNNLAFFTADNAKSITITDETSDSINLLDKLGFTTPIETSGPDFLDYSEFKAVGQKAEIEFNGAPASYDSNTFQINGMTFTAKKESSDAVNVTLTKDVDGIYNTIKSFIDKYNELIETVNKKLGEKRYRDFTPLTDDQRKEMKEDQIKQWEEKAKSGLLRSDAVLTSGLIKFRTSFSSAVEGLAVGSAKSLAEIGISSSIVNGKLISGNYMENGKIYIDDAKLKKAIAENPDQVMSLFTADDGDKESTAGDGLAIRLHNQADALIKQITEKAGVTGSVDTKYTIGKTTRDINKRIDDMDRKLEAMETRYYKQFTAMEQFVNQMSMQSAQLMQQFGG